jgi:colanic acid biosynthesis glycosyl transferase WcaI
MTDSPPRRLLVVALNFAPELTGIGKFVGEMTEYLATQGLEVRVVTAPPYYPAWSVQLPYAAGRYARERLAGAEVWRCPLYVPRSPGGLSRLLHLLSFAVTSLPVIFWQGLTWRPLVVIVVEPPLACAPAAWLAARLGGARAWLHVQDFEVDAAFSLGVLKSGWMQRVARAAERLLMRRFDRVTSISGRMVERLRAKGVSPDRVGLFPNWVDTDRIYPDAADDTLRGELGIDRATRVLLYSGNMGEKQGLELLVEAARRFEAEPDLLFLLCGDGAARPRIERLAAGLPNLRFLPLQPLERLNALLNLAEIHVLPQREGAEDLVMPSKLTAILASGRPVIACATRGTELAEAASAGGLVVPPGDPEAFVAAIRQLLNDEVARRDLGEAGRRYALQHLERRVVLDRMLEDLCRLAAPN